MSDIERLPWRVERSLARLLELPDYVEVSRTPERSSLRCVLARPSTVTISLVLRVHSQSGIPLASASVAVRPGDSSFEAPVALIAMEGYTHLSPRARHEVENRVWSRSAYAVASAA
jgi:hypothetical protein